MRRASLLAAAVLAAGSVAAAPAPAPAACAKPVYLTFDTGHMGVADLIAQVLDRQHVHATFFLANEPARGGGSSLDDHWAAWWRARAAEGHAFGSHTYDHVYWQGDAGADTFRFKPQFGAAAGKRETWNIDRYCAELDQSADRFRAMTGQAMLPLFRAPGGKTSPALLRAVEQRCGYRHVGWADAGFLGDELPSDRYPNATLLQRALRNIKAGDILMAHLGIWSRRDPWAPAVLEPLIAGLKQKGFCFATLAEHPAYRDWLASHPRR
ncbi:polysaccharide deacetylase family protein [Pigmentiphaga soli]|uniref:Polysaccharide deacetylase family protein n=1 Tax=Pigmentiphaga soli TaxID=1007095 RepID=A0ABP8H7F7_9BURK